MSKRIAPWLEGLVGRPAQVSHWEQEKARAELRALLAVARAARAVDVGGECPHDAGCKACNLTRALARLDRLSEGK